MLANISPHQTMIYLIGILKISQLLLELLTRPFEGPKETGRTNDYLDFLLIKLKILYNFENISVTNKKTLPVLDEYLNFPDKSWNMIFKIKGRVS